MNQEQVKNPHLIYPGDVIVLDRSGGGAQLSLLKLDTAKLQPKVRSEPSARSAVPSISPSAIEPFMSRPLVVGIDELEGAARIIAASESRMTLGAGDRAFVRGITKEKGNQWQIFRRGDALRTIHVLNHRAGECECSGCHRAHDIGRAEVTIFTVPF